MTEPPVALMCILLYHRTRPCVKKPGRESASGHASTELPAQRTKGATIDGNFKLLCGQYPVKYKFYIENDHFFVDFDSPKW
jgi:hypothetical protein